ncbi:hypothetical protein [Paenibacillus arenosi]|uniref:CDP-Glycerol:Poly(Glycerophosphate) glycerophosphotransferase n=1 Tax=Paenibacillus arenosi TaxID=2774142 RepID=A0ABR9AUZ9_9BACL|nr:hypothetical protein [Paenibacillus arenosi]MBD8497953.1 hypothetical protein [Paenibacillus arenosi]
MRKHIRQQIVEIISAIQEGIEIALRSEIENAAVLLSDCYHTLNMISEILQSQLSYGAFIAYKELLVQLQQLLECLQDNKVAGHSYAAIVTQLNDNLLLLKNKLMNEPEVKHTIVFLPYSASMWDCMESIWKAAQKDPKCECIVVPIPYYDIEADRTHGQIHYEGHLFPKDVPVINYETFDLSGIKPDVIYIHNPYDDGNRVTSVDPSYYSYELKKHTDMLVYVPYYVTQGDYPENHCRSSALKFVDKVIVQSEQVKEQHAKYIPSHKLQVLGSPKIDKLLYYEKNKPEIPETWEKIIGNKKVVLYNTSLTALLAYGSTVLNKLKYVFSCFEGRNDVVLLWRPHPLSTYTLFSMRPQLLREYFELVTEYKEKQFGIFDDTPDVGRAIAISDAYFGDGTSSLVHMYGISGKPIMVQNVNFDRKPNEEEQRSAWFSSIDFNSNDAWCSMGDSNRLSKINLETNQIEDNFIIPTERRDGYLLYSNIIQYENKIILTPHLANEIAVFDLHSLSFKKETIKKYNGNDPVKFTKAILYKNYVFMTPYMYPAIIRYDIETGELKYYTDWYDSLHPYISDRNKPLFVNGVYSRNNLMMLAFAQDNIIMEFNMDSGSTKIHRVGNPGNNYWGMTFDGKEYWLIQNESDKAEAIVKWNYETGETVEYSDFPNEFIGNKKNFNEIICCGEYLLVFPRFSNMIVKIDVATGKMSEFKTGLDYKEGERKSSYYHLKCNYYFAKKHDGHVVAMSMYDNSLINIDIKTEKVTKMKVELNENDISSYISFQNGFDYDLSIEDYHHTEGKYLTVNKLLDYITSSQYRINPLQVEAYTKIIANADGTCGQKTHDYIIKNIK